MEGKVDFRYLEVFLHVAECGSFAETSRKINISVSAIARQIDLLEKSYGEKLFNRFHKKVLLNETGKMLLLELHKFQASIDKLKNNSSHPSLIKVGTLQSIFEERFVPFMIEKSLKFPMDLIIGNPEILIEKLKKSEIDVAITSLRTIPQGVESIKIYKEVLCLAMSREKPSALHNRCVVFSPLKDTWGELGISINSSIQVNSLNAAIELVKSGLGKSIIPLNIARKHHLKTQELLSGYQHQIYFCVEKGRRDTNEISRFLAAFQKYCQ